MAELIQQYSTMFGGHGERRYTIRAYGEMRPDGAWDGWLEFHPVAESEGMLRTGRETLQPDRTALASWASGLEHRYLEHAFRRANAEVRPAVAMPLEPLRSHLRDLR